MRSVVKFEPVHLGLVFSFLAVRHQRSMSPHLRAACGVAENQVLVAT